MDEGKEAGHLTHGRYVEDGLGIQSQTNQNQLGNDGHHHIIHKSKKTRGSSLLV